jgi:hypothetical protein
MFNTASRRGQFTRTLCRGALRRRQRGRARLSGADPGRVLVFPIIRSSLFSALFLPILSGFLCFPPFARRLSPGFYPLFNSNMEKV